MKTLIQTISLALILTLNLMEITHLHAQCHMSDWAALKALYESTDGDNWNDNTGWEQVIGATPPAGCDLGSMHGVTLDGNGRVQRLELHANQLVGNIPMELSSLSNLTVLRLTNTSLNGNIPPELGNLSNLTTLYLYNTSLSGNIPPELGSLNSLNKLHLYNNQLNSSIPLELGNLGNLVELYLYDNQFSGNIPTTLGNLTNLTKLRLYDNQLSGSIPVQLGNLSNLIELRLINNQLTGNVPAEIGSLSNLTSLWLNNNQLSGCYDDNLLSLCAQLISTYNTNTYISSNNNFDAPWEDFCTTGAGACSLSSCRQSDSLALVALYNSTNGANWTNTWNLNLPMDTWYGIVLNEDGCVTCIDMDGGSNVCINNGATDGNNLSGTLPPDIGDIMYLDKLILHNNNITGSIPLRMGNLSNLTYLSLGNNQLSGNIPAELGNLSNLTYFSLNQNQLSGSIPAELGNLSNLTSFDLARNQFSGSIPSELGSLSNLTILKLSINQLSGCYAPNLMSLCTQLNPNFNNNANISNFNNFDAPWEDFCATGAGTCLIASDDILPGDCNNDGIVNTEDALYWGLAEGFNGVPRTNATTDCSLQACNDWSQSVDGINSKHQDGDGNGTINGQDLQIVISNFGCVNDYIAPNYASGAPIYRVQPQGINNDGEYQYDIYIENGSGAAAVAHGLAFTVTSDVIPISAIAMSTTGSSLHPDIEFAILDGNQCHAALTRTDNFDITCGGPIATLLIETDDVPANIPFEINVTAGSKIRADATLDNITGATAFGMYSGAGASSSNLLLDASVTHEQCNGLGGAIAIPSGGTPPYTYAWSTGANTVQVNNLSSGIYTVAVTDANGLNQNLSLQINGQTPIYDNNGNLLCGNLCPEYLAPSGITGNGLYNASNALNSDATIPTGNAAEYKAGQTIQLKSGFKVQPNAEFSAEIEDCQ